VFRSLFEMMTALYRKSFTWRIHCVIMHAGSPIEAIKPGEVWLYATCFNRCRGLC